jgi:tetratricopeptide (TPR) repeat protein
MLFFWTSLGLYEEGERWLSAAYRHLSRLPRLTSARLLYALGEIHAQLGRYDESERCLRESVSAYSDLQEWRDEGAYACQTLGVTLIYRRNFPGAASMFERALAVYRASGNRRHEGQILASLAVLHLHMDEPELAEAKLLESTDVLRNSGNAEPEAPCLSWLSECAYIRNSPAEALETAARALELLRQQADSLPAVSIRCRIAKFAAVLGDLPLARRSMLESLRIISMTRHALAVPECLEECIRLSIPAHKEADGARLTGFVDHWRGSDPERTRMPFRERQVAAVDGKLRESLEPAEYDSQLEIGKRLSVEDAFALGRAIAESLPG